MFQSIPLAGTSYIKLLNNLDYPRKELTNIQNIYDNECFKWCFVTSRHLTDCNPAKITKSDKDFPKKLEFKDIKFPVKVRDIHKTEKKNSIGIIVSGYEKRKKTQFIYQKNVVDNHLFL